MSVSEQTFAMVDLAGFTALTETHGDTEAADIATRFAEVARDNLAQGDTLVKTIGDAVLLASSDPYNGIALVKRLLSDCAALDKFLAARSGLHHGPAAERAGDYFGSAVNLTARLAAQAGGGQALATTKVARAAAEMGVTTVNLGPAHFKNLTAAVEVHALELGPNPTVNHSVDPVCRMLLKENDATGRLRHRDVDYFFCSLSCAHKFSSDPDRYLPL